MKKISNLSIDFIVADFPDAIDTKNDCEMKNYKDFLFYVLCEYFRVIESG